MSGNSISNALPTGSIWLQRFLRIFLGGIFVYVGYKRILMPHMIGEHLMMLGIVPWSLINFMAMWLLCFEIFVGVLVILGIWLRACSLLLILFSSLCIGLISYAVALDIPMHCGCFVTTATGAPRTWGSLWQEGLILFGCVSLWKTTKLQKFSNPF